MRLSKRVNARLQLAAALVEADNEWVEALHAAEAEQAAAHAAEQEALPVGLRAEVALREPYIPRPLPPLKLASESAIFLPFRDDDAAREALARAQARAADMAAAHAAAVAHFAPPPPTPLAPPSGLGFGPAHTRLPAPASSRTASPNLLGVDLPSERDTRRRSFLSAVSDPNEPLAAPASDAAAPANPINFGADADEDALSEWGVDKFLSAAERDKILKARQRARSSSLGSPSLASAPDDLRREASARRLSASALSIGSGHELGFGLGPADAGAVSDSEYLDSVSMARGTSGTASPSASHSHSHSRSRSRSVASSQRGARTPDPALMARIAAYRSKAAAAEPAPSPLASASRMGSPGPPAGLSLPDAASAPASPPPEVLDVGALHETQEGADHRQSVAGVAGSVWHESRDGTTLDHAHDPAGDDTTVSTHTYTHRGGTDRDEASLFYPRSRPASMGGDSFFGLQVPEQQHQPEFTGAVPQEEERGAAARALAGVSAETQVEAGAEQAALAGRDWAGVGALDAAHAALRRPGSAFMASMATPRTPSPGPHHIPLAREGAVPGDPFAEFSVGDAGRFPTHLSAAAGDAMDDADDDDDAPLGMLHPHAHGRADRPRAASRPMDGLTTRQLQILAAGGTLPEYTDKTRFDSSENVGRPNLLDDEADADAAKDGELLRGGGGGLFKRRKRADAAVGDEEEHEHGRKKGEQRKSVFRLGRGRAHGDEPQALGELLDDDAGAEYDYDEQTGQWHRRQEVGWLARRGVDARLPPHLVMPEPLVHDTQLVELLPPGMRQLQLQRQMLAMERARIAGLEKGEGEMSRATAAARGMHVPPGFVLHDGRGLPPVRFLTVEAAAARTNRRDLRTRDPEQRAKDRETARAKAMSRKKDADEAVDAFLRSERAAELVVPIPADAPPALRERAATATTALFRNPLVHDPADQDGWGWDAQALAETTILDATDEAERRKARFKLSARQKRKLSKAKRAQRKERRRRRRARDEIVASGGIWEGGAISDDSSPDEWGDVASEGGSSAADSDDSQESEPDRWVDEGPAAGTLYGKSLIDLADQRGKTRKKQTRFYGEADLLAVDVGDGTSIAPSADTAGTFRDNPLGTNDTRERMAAVFGTSHSALYEAEMRRRREEDEREAEENKQRLIAEGKWVEPEQPALLASTTDVRSLNSARQAELVTLSTAREEDGDLDEEDRADGTSVRPPPTLDVDVLASSVNHDDEWFPKNEDDDEDDDDDNARPAKRAASTTNLSLWSDDHPPPATPKEPTQQTGPKAATAAADAGALDIGANFGGGLGIPGVDESDSGESEDLPLDQLLGRKDDDSEDELPLVQLANRKRQTAGVGADGLLGSLGPGSESDSEADAEDDAPLGVMHPDHKETLAKIQALAKKQRRQSRKLLAEIEAIKEDNTLPQPTGEGDKEGENEQFQLGSDEDSESDEELLGVAHPQAAIIAQQAALIKSLQEEKAQAEKERLERQRASGWMGMQPPMGLGGMMFPPMGAPMPIGMPPMPMPPPGARSLVSGSAPSMMGPMPPAPMPGMMGPPDPSHDAVDRWRQTSAAV